MDESKRGIKKTINKEIYFRLFMWRTLIMGFAEYLEKKYLGQMVCLSINNGESETITLEQTWIQNREYFEGIIKEVVEGIIVLEIPGEGEISINPDEISYMWQKPLDPHKIMRLSLTKKMNMIGKNL